MIKSVLTKINTKGGLLLFNNPNTLYYLIFNKLYQKFISKKTNDEEIKKFLKVGYFKSSINSKKLTKLINEEIHKQYINETKEYFHFDINDKMKIKIKDFINVDLKDLINKFEKFYNTNISIAKIIIKRNFFIKDTSSEVYSNHYHVDQNTFNHFKVFINLMDIDNSKGPLHIYSKKNSKAFVIKNRYKNRNEYNDTELNEDVHINVGKEGDIFVADTSECLHKAGKVEQGHYRDILFITFMAIPEKIDNGADFFYYEKKFPDSVWGKNDNKDVISIAKPKSLRKTIKRFFEYYKNKLC